MKKNIFIYSGAALLAIGLARPLFTGMWPTGSLVGEVTDPSGAVVPGAKVLVAGEHGSETLSTDEAGLFAATHLTPGTYEVSVVSSGFAPFDQTGLAVSKGGRTEIDAALKLPVLKQEITVKAHAAPLRPGIEQIAGQ